MMQQLLITGEMRSGTTFLANFLNSQEGMAVYADMLVSLFTEAHALGVQDIQRLLSEREKNVLLSNLIQEGKLHHLDFTSIDRLENLSWFNLYSRALAVINGNSQSLIVGVKRTHEEKYLTQLLAAGVKVIYCMRDPRDVLISAKNRFAGFKLFSMADNWGQSVQMAQELNKSSLFKIVKYEDIILQKEKTASVLENFLGQPITTDLEEFSFGHDKVYRDNSSFGDVKKLFDPAATYRWKKQPDQPEVYFVERLLGSQMQSLGYELQEQQPDRQDLWPAYKRQKRKEALIAPLKKIYKHWLH
jgi:hypothetical protein